tara:strand:+ start:130 stop:1113 length:984 start_codon:yes stop_codon:yes gene_type:complete
MASSSIIAGININAENDIKYTKAKLNSNGGKQIGLLNSSTNKGLYLSTPLMLTWGVNEYTNEKDGSKTYDLALQFPNDEYANPNSSAFLKNMQLLESKIKTDAIANSKEWLNKTKLTSDAVDVMWTPILKYPKDKETGEPDYSRSPSIKVKIPYWQGEFKNVELYNEKRELLFSSNDAPENPEQVISDYISKGSNIAIVMQCGGVWVVNGKFGVTWKLFQAIVKPKATLAGKCHITLSQDEEEKLNTNKEDDEEEEEEVNTIDSIQQHSTVIKDSDDEVDKTEVKDEIKLEVKDEIKSSIEKSVEVEDTQVKPVKKKVVKKKPAATE